jgi:hypothetical protein
MEWETNRTADIGRATIRAAFTSVMATLSTTEVIFWKDMANLMLQVRNENGGIAVFDEAGVRPHRLSIKKIIEKRY